MRPVARLLALTVAAMACIAPAAAQREPIGPCSPYAAADGDIPSELPGCARRRRPAPGSLADELDFRRRHDAGPASLDPTDGEDDAPARRRHPGRRTLHPGG